MNDKVIGPTHVATPNCIYTGYADPSRKVPAQRKFDLTCRDYERKWGIPADVALVSVEDAPNIVVPPGFELLPRSNVQFGYVLAGNKRNRGLSHA